jgi:hypothetical protein
MQSKIIGMAYDANRNDIQDMITLYEKTQPEKLAFDSKTGLVYMQNPTTGEVYSQKVPGFVPSEDPTALEQEYNSMVKAGFTGSLIDFAQWKAKQYGTEGTSSDDEKKTLASFRNDITSWNMEGTREQLIRQLQFKYGYSTSNPGGINNDDIARKVYEIFPDNYNK